MFFLLVERNDYLQNTLSKKAIFFTGKGGVGKSAVAWATALLCQQAGKEVGVISWNPLDETAKTPALTSFQIPWEVLDPMAAFKEYTLRLLKFEKIFDLVFENHVLQTFIKAMPGLSETVYAGKIWDLVDKDKYDILIIDLPASGHAYSFFKSPLGIDKIFSKGFVHSETQKICRFFKEPTTRIDFVALPEEMSMIETIEFKEKLKALMDFNFGFLHLNQCLPHFDVRADAVPAPFQVTADRYAQAVQKQKETLTLSHDLRLPTIEIPRFPIEKMGETVRRIAEVLSQ